jgi:hypothetical protein
MIDVQEYETLAQEDVYAHPIAASTGGDVLAREKVFPSVSGSGRMSPKIRVKGRLVANFPIVLQTLKSLYSLLALERGWNSYDAQPIRREVLDFAARWIPGLLQRGTPAPAVVPTVRGGIQLEWHRNNVDLEVYIDAPDAVRFFAEDLQTATPTESHLLGNEQILRDWIIRISDSDGV